jgi:hypothetical protein
MKSFNKISARQERLIAYLLTERTIERACGKAKVAVTTYWRWMQNEIFLTEYRKTRRGILENIVARMQSLSFSAIDTLEKNLNCENPATENRAAQIIIEQSLRGLELLDVENRLEMLESLVRDLENKDEQI